MTATELYRRSALKRRAAEVIISFVLVLGAAVGIIGVLASNARAGLGCTARTIAVHSAECGGLNPGPAAHSPAEVRVIFEADSSR